MKIEIKADVAHNREKRKDNTSLKKFRANWNLRYREEMEMLLAPNEEDFLPTNPSSNEVDSYTVLKQHVKLAIRQLNDATKNGVRLDHKNFVLLDVASNLSDIVKQCEKKE
jgi:hypothetical protein